MLLVQLTFGAALASDPREQLLEAYKDRPMAADHLLMLDTGGVSAQDLQAIQGSLVGLARGLPAGDSLELRTFSDAVSVALPRTEITEEGREALATRLGELALSPGGPSDLGLALASATEALRGPDREDLQLLLVLSDLCHEPAPGSAYAFAGAQGCSGLRGARELESSLAVVRSSHLLLPITLGLGRVDREGQEALFRVAGTGRTLAVRTDEPLGWVQTYVENLPWRKLEAVVEREVGRFALTAEVASVADRTVTLTLRSGLDHVGVDLTTLRFSEEGLAPTVGSLELRPDATLALEITPPEAPFSPIPGSRVLVYDGVLTGTATLEPRAALSRLGVKPGLGQVRVPLRVTWTQQMGPPPWALAVGGLVVVAGALVWRRRQRPV